MPISTVASVALHGLVLGGLLLFGAYLTSVLFKSDRPLPVEPVRLDLGGGNNKPNGVGTLPGVGLQEDADGEEPVVGKFDVAPQPPLTPAERERRKQEFTPEAEKKLKERDTDVSRIISRLEEELRRKLQPLDGPRSGKGPGGPGVGDRKGPGQGPGAGDGKGPGKQRATLTKREQRMLRWHMHFPANSARAYLAQLDGLGAILAIPVREGKGVKQCKVVRNLLARPAQLLDEDLTKIQRIYWTDDKPEAVRGVMAELGVAHRPSYFMAFLPVEVEKRLFDLERSHFQRAYPRLRFDEDRIYGTRFDVDPSRPGEVRVTQMTLNP
jgi:hypothetical protein